MALDLNALINNPQFQTGMALFGASSPKNQGMLQAYQLLQKRRESEQEAELNQARLAAFKEQNEIARLNAAREKRKAEQEENLTQIYVQEMKRRGYLPADDVAPQVPGAIPGAAPAQPMQQPSIVPPAPPAGKYGTPQHILDNLEKTESGGNPLAVGPDIGNGVRAQGAYQFLPSTAKMLKDKGIAFNPFNRDQSRDAADFYIQELVKEHGGDYTKALAAYGGFKAKDPSSYVNKIMGSPEKMAQQRLQLNNQAAQQPKEAQFAQLGSQMDDYNRTRALAGLAAPASEKLKLLAELDKPHTYTPGQMIAGPKGVIQVPNPIAEGNLDVSRQELLVKQQAELRQQGEEARKAETAKLDIGEKKAKAYRVTANVDAYMERLADTAQKLKSHPGLNLLTGTIGGLVNPRLLGENARNANAILENIKGQIFTASTAALRQASESGASVGQQSDIEGRRLEDAMARLNQAQSLKEFQNALDDLTKVASTSRANLRQAYKLQTQEDFQPASGTNDTARSVSGKVMTLDEYLKSKRK